MMRRKIILTGILLGLHASPVPAEGLAQALAAALANHPGPAGKAAEVEGARERLRGAKAARLPTMSTRLGTGEASDAILTARQPLYAFGRIKLGIAESEAELLREEADLQQVRRRLIEDTATAYSELLTADERLAEFEAHVQAMQKVLQGIARRATTRLSTEADVRLAELRLAEAKAALAAAHNERDLVLARLRQLTVVETAPLGSVEAAFLDLPPPADQPDHARDASALLALKRAEVAAAEAAAAHERKAGAPTIYAEINQPLSGGGGAEIGVFLSYELEGLGVSQRARAGAGDAQLSAAVHDLKMAENQLDFTLQQIVLAQTVKKTLIDAQTDMLASYADAVASHERLYAAGQLTWAEVLNIYRERHDNRIQLAQLKGELRSAQLQLAAMLGRLDPKE